MAAPVQRIHGIGNGDVAGAPCVADVAGDLRAALAGRVVIGHHVHVDLSVLGRELGGWAPTAAVDTLRLAKALWPGLPSYSLGKLTAGSLFPPGTGDRHRAGYDAAVTARLFLALAAAAGELPAPGGGGPVTAARLLSLAGVPVPLGAKNDTSRLF
jgi:DNA polymerase III epsilon subunit-like protein